MKSLLLSLLGLLVLVMGAVAYGFYRFKRWASSSDTHRLVDDFDAGLAIPMRDSDTRPRK